MRGLLQNGCAEDFGGINGMKCSHFCAWIALAVFCFGAARASEPSKNQIRFNRDIRPILAENCFACHGADPAARKAKLRLDREEGFFKERDDGPTVVKGKPQASPMYKRILSTDAEEMMPPPKSHKSLTPAQKDLIGKWIAQGAPWEPHWSFIKPELPPEPKIKSDKKWARNGIDKFVQAKLDALNLKPAPESDRYTLARRLSLDLTGLPPEPEQVDAFVSDKSPDAYEKFVDKLMESPRYGEHRGRYWLDAARYADTHGLHFDNYREIWPYRDWVINAFNKNQPFDQFTIEQLAGDLLPNPTKEQIVATGFHRCNMTTNEGGTIPEENLANYARDRVETTSWVWLGLTANCCVCHDHKFDPLTQKDFYSMAAFFRNTTQGALDGNIRDTQPIMVVAPPEDEKRLGEIGKEIEEANKIVAEKRKVLRADYDKWLETAKPADWDALVEKGGVPMLHLPLNEEKPGNEVPGVLSGAAITAKAKEALKWEEGGKFGKAVVIAEKQPLELPGNVGDFEKDQSFSYGCWVKFPKDFKGSGAIMARMDDTADYRGWDLWAQDNEFAAHVVHKWEGNDAFKVVTTGNVRKNTTWQHVMVTYDGSGKGEGLKIIVDGKEAKVKYEKNQLKNSIKTTTPLLIGQRKTTAPLANVAIQDVRIYDHKLKPYEVQRLAALPKVHATLKKEAKDRQAKEKDELFDAYVGDNADLFAATEKVSALEAEKKTIRDRSPVAHIMEEKKGSMPTANILFRGEYDKPKDKVDANVFAALGTMPADAPKNRLGLAKWLVSPEHPLMSRVIVNRFWQEIFGVGLVKTSEDFGIMGEAPSNPELLEYLAVEFRNGWDVKKLIKQIVTSSTYRQSALATKEKLEKDPANRYLSRGPRFRMDAEVLRDYALSASGLLSAKIGGPSVKPYQPEGVWEVVGMPESNTRNYKRDTGEALYRRSMYTFWKRHAPPASMDILNAPSREVSCVRRERTDTPLQALVTLNDPQFIEAARVLAQNVMKANTNDSARLEAVARRVLCRPLSKKEIPVVQQVYDELLSAYKAKPDDAKALLAVGESKADAALDASQLAAWTMVCNQMLNLDEVLNK
jgi:hypothetical protein